MAFEYIRLMGLHQTDIEELIGMTRLVYSPIRGQLIIGKGLLLKCLTSSPVSMISILVNDLFHKVKF